MVQITLITGGGIGIGAATAQAFARAGSHVVIIDILLAEAQETVRKTEADVSDAQVDEVVARVIDQHGRLDTVVANAGIAHRVPFVEMFDDPWSKTLEIDLNGVTRFDPTPRKSLRSERQYRTTGRSDCSIARLMANAEGVHDSTVSRILTSPPPENDSDVALRAHRPLLDTHAVQGPHSRRAPRWKCPPKNGCRGIRPRMKESR